MDFPATVKMVRDKMNISQEDLTRALNVKQVFISFCEQNGIPIKE